MNQVEDSVASLTIVSQPYIESPDIELELELINHTATKTKPLVIEQSIENVSSNRIQIGLVGGKMVPYKKTNPLGLVLVDSGEKLEQSQRGVWYPKDESNVSSNVVSTVIRQELEAGESKNKTYEIWTDPDSKYQDLPAGLFDTLENPVFVEPGLGSSGKRHDWSITLNIS